jgi:hypothetical protein
MLRHRDPASQKPRTACVTDFISLRRYPDRRHFYCAFVHLAMVADSCFVYKERSLFASEAWSPEYAAVFLRLFNCIINPSSNQSNIGCTIAADDETPIHLGRLGSNPYFDAVNAVRPRHTPSFEHRCNQGRTSVSSELPAASREPTRTYQLAARERLQLPAVVVCGTSAPCSRAAGSRERCGVQSVLSQVMATVGLPCSVSWGGSLVRSLHPNLSNR